MMETMVALAATGFGLGLSPFMPGTLGSLLGLPLAWLLLTQRPLRQVLIMALLLMVAVALCHWASLWQGSGDAPRIVADEFLVFPVSVLGLALVNCPWMLVTAFLLFRMFDILKLPPINLAESVGGGLGIVLDDLMAALYTWVLIAIGNALWRRFRRKTQECP
ncbi:phosphatidylglycerophosphatase A [Pseudomonas sp. GD03944]|uniref:phosphatidylglycerophosphatase A family protein n=1 Tax=Pseudomonas sp. GD03944 TaxID=2975409 RepID=UPI00244A8B28|nr:phosphatidylglycerophosphatase A [Pseudomonas sp. GD03944]MDH1265280.1 phosphatidylglycerophosphatase A [Pseudomonas sp. GD03944]